MRSQEDHSRYNLRRLTLMSRVRWSMSGIGQACSSGHQILTFSRTPVVETGNAADSLGIKRVVDDKFSRQVNDM